MKSVAIIPITALALCGGVAGLARAENYDPQQDAPQNPCVSVTNEAYNEAGCDPWDDHVVEDPDTGEEPACEDETEDPVLD